MAEQQRELHLEEVQSVLRKLREAIALREKYRCVVEPHGNPGDVAEHSGLASAPGWPYNVEPSEGGEPPYQPFEAAPVFDDGRRYTFDMRHGVCKVWDSSDEPPPGGRSEEDCIFEYPPDLRTFTADLSRLLRTCNDAAVNSFCYRRLQRNESRFQLYVMEHEATEVTEQRKVPHRDFYNSRKVDTHVHLAAAMNQKHLLRFIKKRVKEEPDQVVTVSSSGEPRTLSKVFEEMGTTPYDLNLDSLGMHADQSTFCRFDKFNLKYNPLGMGDLRNIFLKTDNVIKGRYFAMITQELFNDLEESKYQNAEYRISIYGRDAAEWDSLAGWVVDHKLYSPNNRWMIQVPRLYGMYHAKGMLRNFHEFLRNIFAPLFEVSIDPSTHPKLHLMLQQTTGFDCVDDESKPEGMLPTHDNPAPYPEQWQAGNPHYAYYCYYLYANLYVLNQLRNAKGLSTFCFRPHSGEAGELNHLHAAFLTARGIAHGINLRKTPSLQYLYYITQIGLALSPLSNNALFLRLSKNPFHEFFAVGLNVSLSTDDPLMFHHTKEPLMEEYCVAKQVWRLSSCDLAEIARNSVLQSSFEPCVKAAWLGPNYMYAGVAGNDIRKTNVPNLRVQFRHALLTEERRMLLESEPNSETSAILVHVPLTAIADAFRAEGPNQLGSSFRLRRPLSPGGKLRKAALTAQARDRIMQQSQSYLKRSVPARVRKPTAGGAGIAEEAEDGAAARRSGSGAPASATLPSSRALLIGAAALVVGLAIGAALPRRLAAH